MTARPEKKPVRVTVEALCAGVQTGDVLFFRRDYWVSRVIQWSGSCRWSHVGLVVRCGPNDRLCLLESTRGHAPRGENDVLTGTAPAGVRVMDLARRLTEEAECSVAEVRYGGRRFAPNRTTPEAEAYRKSLREFAVENDGKPYERNLSHLLYAWYDGWGGANRESTNDYFCSELVAEGMIESGSFLHDQPSSEFTVGDLYDVDRQVNPRFKAVRSAVSYGEPVVHRLPAPLRVTLSVPDTVVSPTAVTYSSAHASTTRS